MKIPNLKTAIFWFLTVFLLWALTPIITQFFDSSKTTVTAGQIGDTFGSVNALFSGLAFAGVILTLLMQNRQMELTQEQLDVTRKLQEKTMAQEALIECDRRWDMIMEKWSKATADDWWECYRSFFSLQRTQFIYWADGVIPDQIFQYWMNSRQIQAKENQALRGISGSEYLTAWNSFKDNSIKDEFVFYMDAVHSYANENSLNALDEIINKIITYRKEAGVQEPPISHHLQTKEEKFRRIEDLVRYPRLAHASKRES